MGRVFVLGDVHGAFRAVLQCFERAGFDYVNDHLIALGDICDGWPETKQCVSEFQKIKNLIYIMGNHDTWFKDWLKTGDIEDTWYVQGGKETIASYSGSPIPKSHLNFFDYALPYFILENKLFVHAGIDPEVPIEIQGEETFYWDRTLAMAALKAAAAPNSKQLTTYDEVYLGHTPILFPRPLLGAGVWLMDTGAGWQGLLSMMDVSSKEIFTSDPVPKLYPGISGRKKFQH
jgi:serine/threonine protein phosphatase 1